MFLFKKPAVLMFFLVFICLPTKAALINQWGFVVDSGFTSAVGNSTITGSNTNAFWSAPSTLEWGDAGGVSSFDVAGATNGTFAGNLFTDGAAVDTVTFSHNNNPITAGTSLTSAVLKDRIFLTPLDPFGGPGFAPDPLVFSILFTETSNAGTCAVASPTPCNDIFVLDVEGAGFNPANNTLNQTFFYDGLVYNARLFIDGLGVLTDSACAAAIADNGCIGFTTVESQTNTFQVALDITTRPFVVPEPGTIFILALGLLSLFRIKRV